MDPIFLLKELSVFKELKTALDVGTRDGKIASRLAEQGLHVDAIDINDLLVPASNFQFEKISVTDFIEKNTKKYDLIVAKHLLHLLPDPKQVILELNKISDVFFYLLWRKR